MNSYMLNFSDGYPIGYIKGGKYNGEIIYIDNEKKEEPKYDNDILMDFTIAKNNYLKKIHRLSGNQIEKIERSLMTNIIPDNLKLKKLVLESKNTIDQYKHKEIIINDGEARPTINPNTDRQIFYIAGQSGSGKSTFASFLIESYIKIFPTNKVFLFSNKDYDPVLDQYSIIRVKIDEELINDPIMCSDLQNSLVIMDDIEAISNKKLEREMEIIRDRILNQGRSYKIYFILISHLINDYKKTRTILNEMHNITLFPGNTTYYSLKYLFEKYFGFDKANIKKLINLNTRWVSIYRQPKTTILYEKGAYIVI